MDASLLAITLLVPAAAVAVDDFNDPQSWWAPSAAPRDATVNELARLMKSRAVVAVDVNLEGVRKAEGVIPGALLLRAGSQYALTELPRDTSSGLVFYCASARCCASRQAARRAIDAGYTNVAVLVGGLEAWKVSGQPVDRPILASHRA